MIVSEQEKLEINQMFTKSEMAVNRTHKELGSYKNTFYK